MQGYFCVFGATMDNKRVCFHGWSSAVETAFS